MEGKAEEISVPPRIRSRQRDGKRPNPYSSEGLDKFENVCAELSARRKYISNKTGAPEALVRFTNSGNGWVPVVMREGISKKNSSEGAAGVSILGPVENNNSQKHRELGRKQEFSAIPTAVQPKNIDSKHNHRHDQPKAQTIRRVLAVDNPPTIPARPVQGSYWRTSQAIAYDTSVCVAVFIITLLCLVFSDWLSAIFFTSAWWCVLPILRKYLDQRYE